MKRIFIVAAVLLAAGGATLAQWGSRGCSPGLQLQAPMFAAQPAYQPSSEWKFHPQDRTSVYLYRNGVQVGGYNYSGYWRDYDAATDTWGPMIPCTRDDAINHIGKSKKTGEPLPQSGQLPVPEAEKTQAQLIDLYSDLNKGVDWSKIEDHVITYEGRRIGCDKALEMVQNEIPDHKTKLRLSVIGTETECKIVMDQFNQLEPEIKSRVLPRCMGPGNWATKDLVSGQVVYKEGAPAIYVQDPTGKVLHRQNEPSGCIEAIRKTVKAYDSTKDPDMRKPLLPILPGIPSFPINPLMIAGLLLAGLCIVTMKGKRQ